MKRFPLFSAAILGFSTAGLITPALASIPEPDLTFYGKVLHLGGGEPYLLTQGELHWEVSVADELGGDPYIKRVALQAMEDGTYSYTIRLPHYLVVPNVPVPSLPGLMQAEDASSVPLRNTTILLDGKPLSLADPATIGFDISGGSRGEARRLDLVCGGNLPDMDDDGLPDWWETKYATGLNLADAGLDPDGDGVNNFDEYLRGTDPTGDDQAPVLAAETLISLAHGGSAIVLLKPTDSDSSAEDLVYSVADLPTGFALERTDTGAALTTFTQAQVESGLVQLRATDADLRGQHLLGLSLVDETESRVPAEGSLRISLAAPELLWEGWGLPVALLEGDLPALQNGRSGTAGVTLRSPTGWQSLELPPAADAPTQDVARVYLDSDGTDSLLGSIESDWFVAGAGDQIRGSAGADRVLLAQASGEVSWLDFDAAESDVIDLRGYLDLSSNPEGVLTDFVQFSGQSLRIDRDGDGAGYDDLSLELPGTVLPDSPDDLWDAGNLLTGELLPVTTLFLSISGTAEELNDDLATFTLRRRGDATQALEVPLSWAGTATAGVDYLALPQLARFEPGEKLVSFSIEPLEDDLREPTETIQLSLADDGPWALADGSQTGVMDLLDFRPRVWLEVAERIGLQVDQLPAEILVRRSGALASPLTVRLASGGVALESLDYGRLPATVTFEPNQSVLSVEVLPRISANLRNGMEDVTITVLTDTEYELRDPSFAQVLLLHGAESSAGWLSGEGVTESSDQFLFGDTDGDGITGLEEFAYGGSSTQADPFSILPRLTVRSDRSLHVSYRRRILAPELSYQIEASHNLVEWSPVGSAQTVSESVSPGEDAMEEVELIVPPASDPACFYRLRVILNQ